MSHPLLIIGPDIKTRGVGGVTIHVQRLRDYLDLNDVEYAFKDSRGNSLLSLLRDIKQYDLVHFNLSNPVLQFVLVVYSRIIGKKVVMTLHGNYGRFGWLKNSMVRIAIRCATVPIVINEQSYEACKKLNKRIQLIPAFIPPQKEEPLQNEAVELLERLHTEGRKIFSTNASNVAQDKFGQDIYGVDFLIDYFQDKKEDALVISDPTGNYKKRYCNLQFDNIFFIDYPHPYFEVLKRADYFIRNTSTDGDALSVKEALWLGVPALCTDVVDRPKGVRLFKYNDKDSFEECLNSNDAQYHVRIINGAEDVLKKYKELICPRLP